MKQFVIDAMMMRFLGLLFMLVSLAVGSMAAEELQTSRKSEESEYNFMVGAARVDITPKEEITLAGSPSPRKTAAMDPPLSVAAL